ncbi:IgGFc-binding protein-like [Amphiura filiformis]|uniref:IgGFc-binding protein-like n=1 Tax=Amphiura filiformis TaxID=82378 RepID=UPI003B20E273
MKIVKMGPGIGQVLVTDLGTTSVNAYIPPFDLPPGSTAVTPPISIAYGGNGLLVTTDYGLTITWDGFSGFSILVPQIFWGKVCGMLGNFDGNAANDLVTPTGVAEPNVNLFGNSWIYARDGDCRDEPKEIYSPCDDDEKKEFANKQCGILTDTNGPLAKCFDVIKPDDYFTACVYDLCATCPDTTYLCGDIAYYVRLCQLNGVRFPMPWQPVVGCAQRCPPGSHFSSCISGCPATCIDPDPNTPCVHPCTEGCECDEGKVLSGDRCVDRAQCGCNVDGLGYIPAGTSFLTNDCTQMCRCEAGGEVVCTAFECPINSQCVKNAAGVYECQCREPLINTQQGCLLDPCTLVDVPCLNGGTCVTQADTPDGYSCICPRGWTGPKCETRIGICHAHGDPHYQTLDGRTYDFQGGCRYILLQHWPTDGSDPLFTVLQENEQFDGGRAVSVTKEITVKVYGHVIVMGRNECLLDGVPRIPPLVIPGPNPGEFIEIRRIGNEKVVSTDFGLEVWWDFQYNVEVIITDDYTDQVCGLCGDFDGNADNDFTLAQPLPDGTTTTTSPATFGNSWEVPDFPCDQPADPANDDYDPCDGTDVAPSAAEKCKMLDDQTGPFAQCIERFPQVAEQLYKDCVYDLCVTHPDCEILCSHLEKFAEFCLLKGVWIGEWRTRDFCPPNCPDGSVYEVQVNVCPLTCYDRLTQPSDDGNTDICQLPLEIGPCDAVFNRWRYDNQQEQCVQFVYGGCEGNQNNFESQEECQRRCGTIDGELNQDFFSLQGSTSVGQSTELNTEARAADTEAKAATTATDERVATIDALGALSPCHRTGVAYCRCLDGLIWSGDKCVEPSKCGCVVDGAYYEAGTEFITPDCSQVCRCVGQNKVIYRDYPCDPDAVCDVVNANQCQNNPCQNGGTCIPTTGDDFECKCAPGWFGPTCENDDPCVNPNPCQNGGECVLLADGTTACICPQGWGGAICDEVLAICTAWGDPHYTTFDGKRYDFQGDCSYILAQLWDTTSDLTDFMVIQDNVEWSTNSNVAVTKAIYVHINGAVIYLGPSLVVTVDGNTYPSTAASTALPAGVTICFVGGKVIVKTDFGLQVSWDGTYNVAVSLPAAYEGEVCGLCGNYDNDGANDIVDPSQNTVTNLIAFGNSWVYSLPGSADCVLEPTDTLPYEPCSSKPEIEALSIQKCGIITGMGSKY